MAQISLELAHAIAVWLEIFIYGIYTALFVSTLALMFKGSRRSTGAWVFFVAALLMFSIATLHMILAILRFLRGFILHRGNSGPIGYMYDFTRADTILDSSVFCVIIWIGDALVIYRCFYVWNHNYWIIVLPALLLTASIGVNIYVLWWFTHLTAVVNEAASFGLVRSIYPLALAQNVITTGLIAYKIYHQHRASSAHGIVDRSSKLTLYRILRIMVESAMVYTVQLFILMILYFAKSNAQVILQYAIVPSIGIVFVLIAIRVHAAKTATVYANGMGTIPGWLEDDDDAIEFSTNASLPPGVVTFRVSDTDRDDRDDYSQPYGSDSYAHKRISAVSIVGSTSSHSGGNSPQPLKPTSDAQIKGGSDSEFT
ncbi:hypothetical protein JR316_0008463 [Psilocybe cubensis]|uniref:Uncharacterized protein n=1 Tax=Psilocybe cubensis TaxID=181762 RepID=A0ACB8GWQ3_PSICU|nr:hypothetical protein JR316_0008463 [Psilocybe cubensis]KAH9479867.1 hypothetical protein JR316_0008463 [Psilocybe cubensis]